MEVHLDRGALKNPKVNGDAGTLVYASRADDADGGVVDCEFLVLLERFAKGMQPVADQVFQTAYTRACKDLCIRPNARIKADTLQSAKDPKCFSR